MESRKYIPALFTFLLSIGQVIVLQGFLATNLNAPGTPFEVTIILSGMAFLSALISFIGSIPRVGTFLVSKKISYKAYTLIVVILTVLSLILAGAAIMMGSIEYTQYNASL